MKRFTPNLMLVAAAATALGAGAEATWQLDMKSLDFKVAVQAGHGVFSGRLRKNESGKTENITQLWRNIDGTGNTTLADLNGDGYLDILSAGYGDHGLGWKTLASYNNLANGVTNAPINVEANGVLIVNVAGKSVKVVK